MKKKIKVGRQTKKYNKKADEFEIKTKEVNTPVKYKHGYILCIVHKKNKSADFLNIRKDKDSFTHDGHLYLINAKGVYLNPQGFLLCSYLEGISLPMDHSYIKYETKKVKIHNEITDKDEVHMLKFIKGLKLSSDIMYMVLNQKLADMFTRIPLDMPNLILTILLLVNTVMGFVLLGVLVYLCG